MSWDPVWEGIFRDRDWGRYPPEELIRFIARNYYGAQNRKLIKLLEVGCGSAANVWYMAREGFDVHGLDGSATAIEKASKYIQSEGLAAGLFVDDILNVARIFAPGTFDAVVDVCCLQHNRLEDCQVMLRQIFEVLKPGGRFFAMMLAAGSHGDGLGRQVEPGTFLDITEGPLAGKGTTHFFTVEELRGLLTNFKDAKIEYSLRSMDGQRHVFKLWIVEAQKAGV